MSQPLFLLSKFVFVLNVLFLKGGTFYEFMPWKLLKIDRLISEIREKMKREWKGGRDPSRSLIFTIRGLKIVLISCFINPHKLPYLYYVGLMLLIPQSFFIMRKAGLFYFPLLKTCWFALIYCHWLYFFLQLFSLLYSPHFVRPNLILHNSFRF